MARPAPVLSRTRERLPRRRAPLRIAPLRVRLLASAINLLVGIAALALAIGVGVGAFLIVRRRPFGRARRSSDTPSDRPPVRLTDGGSPSLDEVPLLAKLRSRPVRMALSLLSLAVDVRTDARRSPGARVAGIRIVDARTGGGPTRWQALVRVSTRRTWRVATTELIPWPKVRSPDEDEGFRSELETARREHADDQDALNAALECSYRERKLSPAWISCLPAFARALLAVAIDLPALWSPLKQGIPDNRAGTVYVVEPRGGLVGRISGRLY
jgi:hypothetical protein